MAFITAKGLSLGYELREIVSDLDFTVEKGDYLCVVGENGSGKTTLMKTLLNLKEPFGGQILTGDGLKSDEIGYLPQQTYVQKDFPASVREIVINFQIKKIINCLEHISAKAEDETCYWIYTKFLNDYGKSEKVLNENEYEDYINENLIKKNYLSLSDMKKIAKIEYSEYVGFIYKKKFKPLIKFINKKYSKIIQQRCIVLE